VVALTVGLAAALTGCGGPAPRPAELRLERTDLVLMGRTLARLQPPIHGEVAAARTIWPELASGLPSNPPPALRQSIATAGARTGALALPLPLTREGGLTGPAAGLGGLLKSYTTLTQRGWQFLAAATARATAAGGARGTAATTGATGAGRAQSPASSQPGAREVAGTGSSQPAGAHFLQENAGLYIYCVYDGHYDLSLIGKQLQAAYRKLGGPAAFGRTLTQAQVNALAGAYSIPSVRLAPHPPESLGV
jgi:hypothetical protein